MHLEMWPAVNGIIGGALRAMLRDARRSGALSTNLFDRDLFNSLPTDDVEGGIDPYTPEERDLIIAGFWNRRRQYHAFVFHQFWTGARPSEACALRRVNIDLAYGWEKIEKSLVEGNEGGTKTKRSNRQVRLHQNLVDVLEAHLRFQLDPQAYVFTTPSGTPIDEGNFYKREWLPMLRWLNIRQRPFYNTRHSYSSFMLSSGHDISFISSQTGDSEKTLRAHYAKYLDGVDDRRAIMEAAIRRSEKQLQSQIASRLENLLSAKQKRKQPLISQGLKGGAGEEGRTPDLMLGKHTL